jgi:hypothetical protein
MYGYANKGLDDKFSFQRMAIIFQEISTLWDFSNMGLM